MNKRSFKCDFFVFFRKHTNLNETNMLFYDVLNKVNFFMEIY